MLRMQYMSQLDALDDRLALFKEELGNYSEAELSTKPEENVWSPTELVCHLCASERLSFSYVKKKLSFDPKLPSNGMSAGIRTWLLKQTLRAPIKITSPTAVGASAFPENPTTASELETWTQLRSDIRDYLTNVEEKWLDKLVYKHPFAGRLTLGQMLVFFDEHLTRHQKQLRNRLPR
ncbi:MAG: DinB family protein [Saprospiraceae bacterium]|nr:DinB family protein [Saprospiraceae bacterium]